MNQLDKAKITDCLRAARIDINNYVELADAEIAVHLEKLKDYLKMEDNCWN